MSFPKNDGWYSIKATLKKGATVKLENLAWMIFGNVPLEFLEIGSYNLSGTKASANLRRKPFRIEFEDHGQDFLFWDVDQKGVVIGCEPFQASIWGGKQITNFTSIQVGSHPQIKIDGVDTPIKYEIISMSLLTPQP